jgi:hypothetical protein
MRLSLSQLRACLEHRKSVGKKNEARAHLKIPPKFLWKSFDPKESPECLITPLIHLLKRWECFGRVLPASAC